MVIAEVHNIKNSNFFVLKYGILRYAMTSVASPCCSPPISAAKAHLAEACAKKRCGALLWRGKKGGCNSAALLLHVVIGRQNHERMANETGQGDVRYRYRLSPVLDFHYRLKLEKPSGRSRRRSFPPPWSAAGSWCAGRLKGRRQARSSPRPRHAVRRAQ